MPRCVASLRHVPGQRDPLGAFDEVEENRAEDAEEDQANEHPGGVELTLGRQDREAEPFGPSDELADDGTDG